MAKLHDLATEILDKIVVITASRYLNSLHYLDDEALRLLCLVSKALYPVVARLLYQKSRYRSERGTEEPRPQSFLHTIRTRPDLAFSMKELTVSGPWNSPEHNDTVISLVGLLYNQELKMVTMDYASFLGSPNLDPTTLPSALPAVEVSFSLAVKPLGGRKTPPSIAYIHS